MKILAVMPPEFEGRARLSGVIPGAELVFAEPEQVSDEAIAEAEVILGNLPPARLRTAKGLKWVQLFSSGADAYCAPGVLPPGAVLTNATGAYGPAIAEYLVGAVLTLSYNFHKYRDNQRQRLWRDEGPARPLAGATVLIVGLGDIGGGFARRIRPMGCHVIGVRRTVSEKPEEVDELYPMERLDELLERADVVTLSLPNSPATTGLMDEARLRRMKPGAILVNVGRGTAVRTDDLCRALESGRLGGCALDVTDPEPLPPEHPLWGLPNAIITPHISGGYHLPATRERIMEIVLRNLRAYAAGAPLEKRVDLKTGYLAKD